MRAVQEIQVQKNVGTHNQHDCVLIQVVFKLVETAETGKRNAQMPSCIVHPMLVTKSFTDVFDSYFTRKSSFCVNEGY